MNPIDDPLAIALRAAKAIPKSKSARRQHHQSPTPNTSTPNINKNTANKICSFCESEPAAVLVTKSLGQTTKVPLCLVHYYTTRSCRIDPKKVTILGTGTSHHQSSSKSSSSSSTSSELNNQLSYMQDLFSEAFTELQKDISTEAARSFHEMAQRASDPLSILNDHASSTSKPSSHGGSKTTATAAAAAAFARRGSSKKSPSSSSFNNINNNKKAGAASDGGFMKHVQRREIDLMIQQQKLIDSGNDMNLMNNNTQMPPPLQKQQQQQPITQRRTNPCKRRKMSSKPTWNLILDHEEAIGNGRLDPKNSIVDITQSHQSQQTYTYGVSCSCGSDKVELFGNITGRNNDVPKAETWGTKRDHEVSTRYQCQRCGKVWNEEE